MTVSVMVWRETFSVWTLMAGSFFRNAQNVAAPSRATMMLAMMMNFPRPLRLGLGASAVGGKIGGVSTRRACPKTHELSSAGIAFAVAIGCMFLFGVPPSGGFGRNVVFCRLKAELQTWRQAALRTVSRCTRGNPRFQSSLDRAGDLDRLNRNSTRLNSSH